MAAVPASDPRARPGRAGSLLVAALVVALAAQLAHWTWVFLSPPAVGRADAQAAAGSVDLAAIGRLFGAPAPGSAAPSSALGGLRLKGVVAPTPGVAASAIFSTGAGRDVSVFLGGEIAPGLTLAEVLPDHVIVARGGDRERVDLEAAHSAPAASRAGRRAPGFHLEVARAGPHTYSLSRRELDQALRDPNQLGYLGRIGMPRGGGVRMEAAPPGSLAAKLGLQSGDLIRSVNGQRVASTGDLARLYQEFATLSQVQAEVQRGSAVLHLTYRIR